MMVFVVFTIVKNEHEFLDEWIQYHLNIGVNKIFVFDDVYSKPHECICKKYGDKVINKNIISIFKEEIKEKIKKDKLEKRCKGLQVLFMKSVLYWLQQTTNIDWVFYIDCDEFITFENNLYSFDSVFNQFNEYDIVQLQWMNYNANGHIFKPVGSVINNYTTTCTQDIGLINPYASSKLAFNMKKWNNKTIKTNHHLPLKANWCKTDFTCENKFCYKQIYLRHYITKSFEDYLIKLFIRGQFQGSKNLDDFFIVNKNIDKNNKDVNFLIKKYCL